MPLWFGTNLIGFLSVIFVDLDKAISQTISSKRLCTQSSKLSFPLYHWVALDFRRLQIFFLFITLSQKMPTDVRTVHNWTSPADVGWYRYRRFYVERRNVVQFKNISVMLSTVKYPPGLTINTEANKEVNLRSKRAHEVNQEVNLRSKRAHEVNQEVNLRSKRAHEVNQEVN